MITIKATYDIWNENTNAHETTLTRSVEITEQRFDEMQNSFGMDYLIQKSIGTSINGKPHVRSYTKDCAIEVFNSNGEKITPVMTNRAETALGKLKATTLDFDED